MERNEKDSSSESQKHEAYICEKEDMMRIQEGDLNAIELKIKVAKSKMTSDQADWFIKTCHKWKNHLKWNSEWIFKWIDKQRDDMRCCIGWWLYNWIDRN